MVTTIPKNEKNYNAQAHKYTSTSTIDERYLISY